MPTPEHAAVFELVVFFRGCYAGVCPSGENGFLRENAMEVRTQNNNSWRKTYFKQAISCRPLSFIWLRKLILQSYWAATLIGFLPKPVYRMTFVDRHSRKSVGCGNALAVSAGAFLQELPVLVVLRTGTVFILQHSDDGQKTPLVTCKPIIRCISFSVCC